MRLIAWTTGLLLAALALTASAQSYEYEPVDRRGGYEAGTGSSSDRYGTAIGSGLGVRGEAAGDTVDGEARASLSISEQIAERIRARINASQPQLKIDNIQPSRVRDIYLVDFANGTSVYATSDGSFFFLGDLYKIGASGFENLSDQDREDKRAATLASLPPEDLITYPARGEIQGVVYIFNDASETCDNCRRLYENIETLNERGVEVRFIPYPEKGVGSPDFKILSNIWCAADKYAAMEAWYMTRSSENTSCASNPVPRLMQVAYKMGLPSMPVIITEDGKVLGDYVAPARLAVYARTARRNSSR